MAEPAGPAPDPRRAAGVRRAAQQPRHALVPATRTGPGRVLIAVYAVFAVAATGRATLQLVADFDRAPLAYLLSAVAAVVYLLATVALTRGDRAWRRVAWATCLFELGGVLTVGTITSVYQDAFPDETVWSGFGRGYGYLPLLLPVLGLAWLARTRPGRRAAEERPDLG